MDSALRVTAHDAGSAEHDVTRRDWLVAALLLAPAALLRVGALPRDGLFFDDAWVAALSLEGTVPQLLRSSVDHPTFSLLLAPLRSVAGSTTVLALPAFVAGTALPSALYLFLRWFGHRRSVCLLLSAVLLVAPVAVAMSGRVKTYVFDALILMAIAVVVERLAARQWRAGEQLLWLAIGVAVATFSVFALLASAAAAVVLALHPRGDLRARVIAVAIQAVVLLGYLRFLMSGYDTEGQRDVFERFAIPFVGFTWNPVDLAGRVAEHYEQVVSVYLGHAGWLSVLLATAAAAGLVLAAVNGARGRAVVARYMVVVLGAAAVGSIAEQFPFGAQPGVGGGRTALWFAPAIALGLAEVIDRVVARLGAVRSRSLVVDGVLVAAAAVAVAANVGDSPSYEKNGTELATHFVDSERDENGLVLLMAGSEYPYAIETGTDWSIRSTNRSATGTALTFGDPRVVSPRLVPREEFLRSVEELASGTEQVLVFHAHPLADPAVLDLLRDDGFANVDTRTFDDVFVTVWVRDA